MTTETSPQKDRHLTSIILLLLALILSNVRLASANQKVGLVLGGGGARGAAHIGVLKVLEEQNIAIDYIAGTSMGAIVGSLYAYGYSAAEIEEIVNEIDWNEALTDASSRDLQSIQRKVDDAFLPSKLELGLSKDGIQTPEGLIQGQHLNLLLRRLLAGHENFKHFDDLPIPYRAVATDIVTGKKVVLESGDLVEAVRASMSVPGIFQPVRMGEHLLVDGGIVNNVPVQVVKDMGAERLIVVDVGSPLLTEDQLKNPLTVTNQVMTVMTIRETQRSLSLMQKGDVYIRPDMDEIDSTQFVLSDQIIPKGELAASQVIDQLQAFKATDHRYQRFQANHQTPNSKPYLITQLVVHDTNSRTTARIKNQFQALVGGVHALADINRTIAQVYGEGRYEKLTYQLLPIDENTAHLVIHPVDKHWGPNFLRTGFKFSDDFNGESAFQLAALARLQSRLAPTAEWRLKLGVGEVSELGASWMGPLGSSEQFYIKPYVNWRAFNQRGFASDQDIELLRFRWNRGKLGLDLGVDHSTTTRSFIRLERGRDKLEPKVGNFTDLSLNAEHYGFIGLGLIHDSLDDAIFPTRGRHLTFQTDHYNQSLGSDTNAMMYRMEWHQAFNHQSFNFLTGIKAATTNNDELTLQSLNFLGGMLNLSGLTERQLGGSHLFLSRFIVSKQLNNKPDLLNIPLRIGASVEAGNTWDNRSDASFDDLIFAGSLFLGTDTPLGPLFLGFGHTDRGDNSIYFQFGSLLDHAER